MNMNKRTTLPLVIAGIGLLSAAPAFARDGRNGSPWSGLYAGVKAGANNAAASGVSNSTTYTTGLEVGYLTNLNNPILVAGVDGYADFNPDKSHGPGFTYGTHVYGADVKLGLDNGSLMPYAKLGYAHVSGTGDLSGSGSGFHGGLGAEYMAYRHVGIDGEWTYDRVNISGTVIRNNNYTIGVNDHF